MWVSDLGQKTQNRQRQIYFEYIQESFGLGGLFDISVRVSVCSGIDITIKMSTVGARACVHNTSVRKIFLVSFPSTFYCFMCL